jgi:hypothetical protein
MIDMETVRPATRTASTAPKSGNDAKGSGGGIERRRSKREPVTTLGMLRSIDESEFDRPRQVMVSDVSLHGCGFRCMERLDNELTYVIEIGVGPLHLTSQLRIVRNRVRPDGTYDVGAEFI